MSYVALGCASVATLAVGYLFGYLHAYATYVRWLDENLPRVFEDGVRAGHDSRKSKHVFDHSKPAEA